MKTTKATKFATDGEIRAALRRWPRRIPDGIHIRAIMVETGLSPGTARLALAICRGDSEGDCIDLDE